MGIQDEQIPWAGVLTTGADVAFMGSKEGYFFALDTRIGELRWKASLSGKINSAPMTFAANGSST